MPCDERILSTRCAVATGRPLCFHWCEGVYCWVATIRSKACVFQIHGLSSYSGTQKEDREFTLLIAVAQLQSRCHQRFHIQSGLTGIERWNYVFSVRSITKASCVDLRSVAANFSERICCAVHRLGSKYNMVNMMTKYERLRVLDYYMNECMYVRMHVCVCMYVCMYVCTWN
jgi:hypothetical protein